MTKSTLRLILTLAIIAAPTAVLAEPLLQNRCATEALDRTAALQRVEWARRCGLLTNTGGPTSDNGTREYTEINPNRAYSASSNGFDVNFTYKFCRYLSSLVTIFQETSGPTAGFWKWASTTERSQPLYPIYETTPTLGTGTPLFPQPSLPNDCHLYLKDPTGGLSLWGGNFYVVAYCSP